MRAQVLLVIGFMLTHRASSHLYLTAFASGASGIGYIGNLPFVFSAALSIVALGALVLALAESGRLREGGMPVLVPGLLGVAGCLPGLASLDLGGWFPVVAGILYAASFSLLNFSWYAAFARSGALEGSMMLTLAIIGSSLLASGTAESAVPLLYARDAAFAAAGTAALLVTRRADEQRPRSACPAGRDDGGSGAPCDRSRLNGALRDFAAPLSALAALEMATGTLNVTAINGYAEAMGSIPVWASTGIGAGCFLALLLFAKSPRRSDLMFVRVFPVLMALLGAFVIVGESLARLTGAAMVVTYSFFTFSIAYTLFAICEARDVPAAPLLAADMVAVDSALVAGLSIGIGIDRFSDATSAARLTTSLVFMMYMLAVAALFLGLHSSKAADRGGRAGLAEQDAEEERARVADFGESRGLTSRECEVLALVLRGWGAKQIAAELGITENTVWSHVKHIYAKLGVQSKQEAINLWEGRDKGGG